MHIARGCLHDWVCGQDVWKYTSVRISTHQYPSVHQYTLWVSVVIGASVVHVFLRFQWHVCFVIAVHRFYHFFTIVCWPTIILCHWDGEHVSVCVVLCVVCEDLVHEHSVLHCCCGFASSECS